MSIRRSAGKGDPVTLEQANSVFPLSPPVNATLAEKRDFYQRRADMYRKVADTDQRHYYEALACAGLEQEQADKFAAQAVVVIEQEN
jgi:hypothetical protein